MSIAAPSQSSHPTFDIPTRFTRAGRILTRPASGGGTSVVGDPCIVRDDDVGGYRMFLFHEPPGHAQSICRSYTDVGPGCWEAPTPLQFTNPQVGGKTHKPYVVQLANQPNVPAKIDGRYCLVSVRCLDGVKFIHQAWSSSLAGPWTWEPQPLIPVGQGADFDAKHTDAVSGFSFPDRNEILYYYMGYPRLPQPRAISPYGNAQGAAVQKVGEKQAVKLGQYLPPCQQPGHWASGYLGGLQLLPGRSHRWIALLNASPTAPDPGKKEIWTEEPAPSLGGFAWCDEAFPIKNWHYADQPIRWIEDLCPAALADGEGTNLWRHHLLALPDGRLAIYYNSGYYGKEQLYMIWAR